MSIKTSEERKIILKYCTVTLKEYLGDYMKYFSKDIDELWTQHDLDGNNYLDKEEARIFIGALYDCIISERKQSYNADNFDVIFSKIDTDGDKFLSKVEMSIFIKKMFAKKRDNSCCRLPNNSKSNFILNS